VSASAEGQAAAEELLKQLKVPDLLLGTLASLVQLAYAKLAEGETDQARLAIEALRAVTPVLEGAAPEDALRDLRQATANLQIAYADKLRSPPEQETQKETQT
jgi:hypothetical protein